MNKNITRNEEKLEVTLEITLDAGEFAPFLDKAFKKEVKEVSSDGFRKGKMPKEFFIKKYGVEALYNEAINLAIADTYSEVIKAENIKGIAFPTIDVKNVSDKDGLEYSAVVAVAPEFNDVKEDEIKVEPANTEATSEEVDVEVNKLLDQETELVVSDEAAKLGDTVVIDFKGFVDGEAFEGGEGSSYPLELGSNSFIPGFEDQLVGSKAGDEVKVNVTFPEGYQAPNLAGKDSVFECTVHEVKVKEQPSLDDEFVKNLGMENVSNVEELKSETKKNLEKSKEENKENLLRENAVNAIDAYAKTVDFHIHEKHIEEETNNIVENFEQQNQIKIADYANMIGKSVDEVKEEIKDSAIDSIKRRTIMDSLATKHNIEATEEDIDAEIKKLADMYQVDSEVIKQSVAQELSQIQSMIKDQKVLDKISK